MTVLVIGAGLSGLTAADVLSSAGRQVLVVDKGRGVGGRLATRRIGDATLDHGAQFFTVRSDRFRAAVDRWLAAGVVEEWCKGFPAPGEAEDGYPRYRTSGGMNALAKHLAAELKDRDVQIVTGRRINAILPLPLSWAVTYEGSVREPDEAETLIATPPVPQVLELTAAGPVSLDPEVGDRLTAMTYHKVIAVMAHLDRSPELPPPGALQRPTDPVFTFVADNQAKGISESPAMTFHLAHDLSARLYDQPDGRVLAEVEGPMTELFGPADPVEIQVKRWRYSGPVAPYPEPYAMAVAPTETRGPLVVAGDGFGGSKVEGAFLSGLAAAEAVVAVSEGQVGD